MEEVKFKYCTEFLIQYMNPGVTEDDVNKFRTRLTASVTAWWSSAIFRW